MKEWFITKVKKWWIFFDRKLIRAMQRKHKDPRYIARATMIGLGSAFAPFPVQMPVVFAIWVIGRKIRWRFSLVVGLAWTFASNTFTNIPILYMFYITGSKLRGQESQLSYDKVSTLFSDGMLSGLSEIVTEYGFSMLIGSLPWMVFFAIFGYWLGYAISVNSQKAFEKIKKVHSTHVHR